MRQTISSTGRGIVGCEDQSVSKEKKSRNVTRLGKKKPCYNSVNFFQDIILFTSGVHRGGVLVLNIGPSRRGLKKYEVSIKYWTRCRAHISCPPPQRSRAAWATGWVPHMMRSKGHRWHRREQKIFVFPACLRVATQVLLSRLLADS